MTDTTPPTGSKCGDPFTEPVFTSGSQQDPWRQLLQAEVKKDKERCDAWKDEVQNLLIFASLFSAIVTSFLMESHKALKEDDGEVLLSRLLGRMDFIANGTRPNMDAFTELDSFSIKAADRRINIFWFLSLVCNLATVLVGVIALQWLREYQRTPNCKDARTWYSLHSMHTEALDTWGVPEIFTSLPLLLELGLAFFFIGLCDFVYKLDALVAAITIIAILLTFLFFVITTMLPTLQALGILFASKPYGKRNPRVQSPYKSPQSWIFHQFVVYSIWTFSMVSGRSIYSLLSHGEDEDAVDPNPRLINIPLYKMFSRTEEGEHLWDRLGVAWLYQRDFDRMESVGNVKEIIGSVRDLTAIPCYDAIRALTKAREAATEADEHITVNRSFSDLSKHIHQKANEETEHAFGQYIHLLLMAPNIGGGNRADSYRLCVPVNKGSPKPTYVLRESNELSFRSAWNSKRGGIPPEVRTDLIERAIRLTEWMFLTSPYPMVDPKRYEFTPVTLLVHEFHADKSGFYSSGHAMRLAWILRSFLEKATSPTPKDLSTTSYASVYTTEFLCVLAEILGNPGPPLDRNKDDLVIGQITTHLADTVKTAVDKLRKYSLEKPDYLFFVLFIFEQRLPKGHNHDNLSTVLRDCVQQQRTLDLDSGNHKTLAHHLNIRWDSKNQEWMLILPAVLQSTFANNSGMNTYSPSIRTN